MEISHNRIENASHGHRRQIDFERIVVRSHSSLLLFPNCCSSKRSELQETCRIGASSGETAISGSVRCAGCVLWPAQTVSLRLFRLSVSSPSAPELLRDALYLCSRSSQH